jgi:hypothetical protein
LGICLRLHQNSWDQQSWCSFLKPSIFAVKNISGTSRQHATCGGRLSILSQKWREHVWIPGPGDGHITFPRISKHGILMNSVSLCVSMYLYVSRKIWFWTFPTVIPLAFRLNPDASDPQHANAAVHRHIWVPGISWIKEPDIDSRLHGDNISAGFHEVSEKGWKREEADPIMWYWFG